MARPIDVWGDPDSKTFIHDYLTVVTFMGYKVYWHKWAVEPLMYVQTDIVRSAVRYKFYDCQTYNNRNIAGTSTKSNHAWALAMDINPDDNPYHGAHRDLPPLVVEMFRKHGFRWGGDYRDWMHMEYLGEPVKEIVEEDMNDLQSKQLDELRNLVAVKQSYVSAITNALLVGNKPKAAELNSEFWKRWPDGESGLPKGWKG